MRLCSGMILCLACWTIGWHGSLRGEKPRLSSVLLQGQQCHHVRFRNDTNRRVDYVEIGALRFENVEPGTTTSYEPLPKAGDIRLRARLTGYIYLTGTLRVRYILCAPWTVTLTEQRKFVLEEDPPESLSQQQQQPQQQPPTPAPQPQPSSAGGRQ